MLNIFNCFPRRSCWWL